MPGTDTHDFFLTASFSEVESARLETVQDRTDGVGPAERSVHVWIQIEGNAIQEVEMLSR